MKTRITRSSPVRNSRRVLQMRGIFDVPAARQSTVSWDVHLPIEDRDWQIGLIVGPSGSGKSTIARELFGDAVVSDFDWPAESSVLDAFPMGMGIKEITGLLSSVGFSSPPNWVRPFGVLSSGEQFRVSLARALAEKPELAVIDEFTSVVDRTVAQIGSAAVAKTIRRGGRKLIAVTCHYDVADWLQPDWVYQPAGDEFQWRCLQPRPGLPVDIARCRGAAVWPLFKNHHYLSGQLNRSAKCFLAAIDGRPAAFGSVTYSPHPTSHGWREHRFVVLPDFQGAGIGNRLSEYVGSLFRATGRPYRGVTSHPAFVHHRLRSPLWKCIRRGGMVATPGRVRKGGRTTATAGRNSASIGRFTWSFQYVGPPNRHDALRFGLAVAAC